MGQHCCTLQAKKGTHSNVAAGVNQPNSSGETPLFVASQRGLATTAAILDRGADVNHASCYTSKNGDTPLTVAIQYKHTHVARILFDRGVDASRPNMQVAKLPWILP
eukprot:TRINITY_DN22462_c0_g1_i1.p3 TRINITY_DN22462_c0_g1~~TRINITY_DN22462_c0_g1_i1.p3  ORF type:complete len:107 (-),score=4.56 TRINITY_DN22462_c0_g1_i1:2-322(-)